MQKEPAVIITSVTSFATAIIGLVVAFGVDLSDEQQTALLSALGAFCALLLVLGPVIRQFVYSPNSTQALVDTAKEAGATGSPAPPVVP